MADAKQSKVQRPLSPHLTIYRPQYTSITSIFARITGVALLGAAFLVIWWFCAAATSPEYFAVANGFLTSWFGDLVMTAALWAVCYHFLSGLRHLWWDTGRGLELSQAKTLAYGVVIGSFVLTALVVIAV
ncbi:MAG: succinate dehydrogenase, cytochrome b556 subunit [Halocynthiibacter sp.]